MEVTELKTRLDDMENEHLNIWKVYQMKKNTKWLNEHC